MPVKPPLLPRIALTMFAILMLCSCRKRAVADFTPLTNGFGYGHKVIGSTEKSLRLVLLYQDTNGNQTIVWPYLLMVWGDNIQITNNLAILIGGKAEKYNDGIVRLKQRLMAFEGPSGPPLDITDQVLEEWCASNHLASTNVVEDSFVGLTRTNDGVQIDFSVWPRWDDGKDQISWTEIRRIAEDVKNKGTLRKENSSGVTYLQK